MKTILTLAFFCILLTACKKEIVYSQQANGFIKMDLNGKTSNYIYDAKFFRHSDSKVQIVAYKKEVSNYKSLFSLTLEVFGPLAPSTYIASTNGFPKINVSHTIEYGPGVYGSGSTPAPFTSSIPFKVIIEELGAEKIKGTLEGDLEIYGPNGNATGQVETVRNGSFEIKL